MYTDAGERAFEALGEIARVFLEPLMPRYRGRIASGGGGAVTVQIQTVYRNTSDMYYRKEAVK